MSNEEFIYAMGSVVGDPTLASSSKALSGAPGWVGVGLVGWGVLCVFLLGGVCIFLKDDLA